MESHQVRYLLVILSKGDYASKIEDILKDKKKFKRVRADPTEEVKQKANQAIHAQNAVAGGVKFDTIVVKFGTWIPVRHGKNP